MASMVFAISLSSSSSSTRAISIVDHPRIQSFKSSSLNFPLRESISRRMSVKMMSSSPSTPQNISEKITESIKNAEQICAEDPISGQCAAAWDEVEEVSAAASHARVKAAAEDPLEAYCKDNPETDECRTYED